MFDLVPTYYEFDMEGKEWTSKSNESIFNEKRNVIKITVLNNHHEKRNIE